MSRDTRAWLLLAAAVAVGALAAGWFLHRTPAPVVRYRTVTVTDTVLREAEPRIEIRWRDRIVYRTAPAEQVATAPAAAVSEVQAFCAPAIARLDTIPGHPSGPPIPRALLLRSGRLAGGHLTLWGPTSTGDDWRGDYRVRPPLTWRVDGDSVVVRASRWSGLRTWAGRAALLGLGAAAGYLAGR